MGRHPPDQRRPHVAPGPRRAPPRGRRRGSHRTRSTPARAGRGARPSASRATGWAAGKRWRPFLTACAYKALQDDPHAPLPEGCAAPRRRRVLPQGVARPRRHRGRRRARYGEPTLHAEHGVPVALNVGDLLVGEGYRLLAGCGAPAARASRWCGSRPRGIARCASGRAPSCRGRDPEPLTPPQVLDIFRKTAPAFEVALRDRRRLRRGRPDVARAVEIQRGARHRLPDPRRPRGPRRPATGDIAAGGRRFRWRSPTSDGPRRGPRPVTEAAWRRAAQLNGRVRDGARPPGGATERSRPLLEAYKEQAIRALAGRSRTRASRGCSAGSSARSSASRSRAGAVSLRLEMLQVAARPDVAG